MAPLEEETAPLEEARPEDESLWEPDACDLQFWTGSHDGRKGLQVSALVGSELHWLVLGRRPWKENRREVEVVGSSVR